MRLKLILVSFLLSIACCISAQEICGNGIDDDGNGLIDCYDPQCAGQGTCAGFFYGSVADACRIIPPVGPFGVQQAWQSTISTSTRSIVLVADIDGDGKPEVIAHDKGANELYVLDGASGALKLTISCPAISDYANALAVADTDKDGFGEIYAVTASGLLYCFEHTGAMKAGFIPPTINIGFNLSIGESAPGIADFDGDGIPEVYAGYNIFNSQTGAVIAVGNGSKGFNAGNTIFGIASGADLALAADVLPDSAGLELICGNTVYTVNIAAMRMTAVPNSLSNALGDGYSAVADMDGDGKLDIVVTSKGKVYVWNPRTGQQMGSTFTLPNNTKVGGRPNIADYDNDGKPEIGVGAKDRYVAIDFNTTTFAMSTLWTRTIKDQSEETTGTAFDFEGDGVTEVVYRSEDTLYVFDGATGNTKLAEPCGSGTRTEFPTIADVNNDGQADIICNCSYGTGTNSGTTGNVRVFRSNNDHWIASRKVMNQHAYNVTNINDNLSVPPVPQSNALLPKLNNFLCQSPVYTSNWQPIFVKVPDLYVSIDTFLPCKPLDSLTLTIKVCNKGSIKTDQATPVTFYNGNPATGGSKIATHSFTASLDTNTCLLQSFILPWANSSMNLFVAINDLGTNPAAPQFAFGECDSTNNFTNRNIIATAVKPNITGLATSYCLDSIVIPLSGIPAGGTFSGAGISGSTFNPKTAGLGAHLITYTMPGACASDTSITVTVTSSPPANAGTDVSLCPGQSDTIGVAPLQGYTYTWSPSSGLNSTSIARPVVTLTNNTSNAVSYTYVLQLQQGSCTGYDSVKVTVYPSLLVSAGADRGICLADTQVQLSGATPTGGTWSGKGVTNASGIFNPSIAGGGAHTLYYAYTDNTSGCSSTDSILLTVNSLTAIDAGPDKDVCGSRPAQLQASGGTSYVWTPATGLNNPNISNPTAAPAITTVYHVLITDNNGCSGNDSLTVRIYEAPKADFSTEGFCGGINITDLAIPKGAIQYNWHMGNGVSFDSLITSYNYNKSGDFEIWQIVTLGTCADTMKKPVHVFSYPVVDFTADPAEAPIDPLTPIHFRNTSLGSSQWKWNFGDGESSAEMSPIHTYADTGRYVVSLTAKSAEGCEKSKTFSFVRIFSETHHNIYIPNAVSPNGDGKNDLFMVYGNGVQRIMCNVFNRLGEMVYQSEDMLSTGGWDTYYKNVPVPAGVYVYDVAIVFDNHETRKMIGTLTIIR